MLLKLLDVFWKCHNTTKLIEEHIDMLEMKKDNI